MKLTQSMVDEILETGQEALNLIEEKYPIGTEVEEEVLRYYTIVEFEEEEWGNRFQVAVRVRAALSPKEVNDGS